MNRGGYDWEIGVHVLILKVSVAFPFSQKSLLAIHFDYVSSAHEHRVTPKDNHALMLFCTGKVMVNDATVLPSGADGSVDNGVVHAIDTVLMPPSLHLGH